MEAVAFVEELGRHGDVLRRHVLHRLPARVGRGYGADVMIDDPHVAAEHLEIRLNAAGVLEAVDLGSLNGTLRRGDAARVGTIALDGDDVLRIGQTQLRIRLPSHAVSAELLLQRRPWDRHPITFFVGVALVAFLGVWYGYVATFDTDTSNIFSVPVIALLGVLTWTAVWSLVLRTLHGKANFWAYGVAAFLGSTALLLADTLLEYIYFSFDLSGFELGWQCGIAAVIAAVLYRHLRLTARMSPRFLAALTVSLIAVLLIGFQGYETIRQANKPGLQAFDKTIKPSMFLFARGIAPVQFVDVADKLRASSDEDAATMTKR